MAKSVKRWDSAPRLANLSASSFAGTPLTWNPSDVDRTPGIDDRPCLNNDKPCQILTWAGEVGCAVLDCRLRICEDGVRHPGVTSELNQAIAS
jgi:hypothetical protein